MGLRAVICVLFGHASHGICPLWKEGAMKRLGIALLVLLLSAGPTFAKAGAEITAPDGLSFGDSFMPTWIPPNNYVQKGTTYLYASLDCFQDGQHVQGGGYVDLDGVHEANSGPFTLGNPGYWDSGAAACFIRLFTFDFSNARERSLAFDAFEVGA